VDSLSSDFAELLKFLNARHVRALIVGGHALAFHGHPRYTKDLDIFIEPSAGNAAAVLQALEDFGFGRVGLTEDAWAGRVEGSFAGVPFCYLGRDAFLKNKLAAGRPQDLADIGVDLTVSGGTHRSARR